jgi:large subunit ribosomal protein L22
MEKKMKDQEAQAQEVIAEPSYRAVYKYAPISAQKVRAFANLIRGKSAGEAAVLLACYPNRGARMLEKTLKSAIGNADDLGAPEAVELTVAEVRVDEGPMRRRWRAGSRGASVITKRRSSHISVVLQ